MTDKVLLKKYANRRLYDTEKSEYITLNEVTEMIRQGRQVEVVDAKTNEDVTAFILTQIILESAKTKNALLPPPILHLIIQYGDNILVEFFDKYLYQTINNYIAARSSFEDQFKKWLDLGTDISGMAQKSFTDTFPFKSFADMFSHPDKKPPQESDKTKK